MLLQLPVGPSQLEMVEIRTKGKCLRFQLSTGNLAMQLCPTHMNNNIALITLLSATQTNMLFMGLGGLLYSSRAALQKLQQRAWAA